MRPRLDQSARISSYRWLVALALGPLLLLILQLSPTLNQAPLHSPLAHVIIVLSASLLGMAMALLVLDVARRAQDARVFLVGMGFLSIASILVTHAIGTPNVLMTGRDFATSFSAPLSLAFGSLFFALSGLTLAPSLNQAIMRYARLLVAMYFIGWLTYNGIVLLAIPAYMPAAPTNSAAVTQAPAEPHSLEDHTGGNGGEYGIVAPAASTAPLDRVLAGLTGLQIWILGFGLACYGFACYHHYRFFRLLPSQIGFALVAGIAFFAEAMLTQYFAQVYTLSFWLYHTQEFVGFGAIAYAMLAGYRRSLDEDSLLESVFLSGTRARLQARYATATDSLIAMLSQSQQPDAAARNDLRAQFELTESQMQVIEGAAQAVARERRQRQELEQLNLALRELEEYKRQLTQMVVHDLKNPLTALTGYLEVLKLGQLKPEQQDLLKGALRSSTNLGDLIGDLLDVGQFEEGRLVLEHSTFAIGTLLQQCASELEGWLLQEHKSIDIEIPPELLAVRADHRLMRRVFLNLLSNAIKHTPSRTQIWLRVIDNAGPAPTRSAEQPGDRHLVIEVADNGLGIPADQLEHIFERFGRYNNGSAAGRQTSTGLGLTFCRLVVEAHGGSISVSSVVGSGTTFRVVLPIC